MTQVAILLGTYNRLEMLKRCVQSVLQHDRNHYQLIVADAGSTDGTLEFLDSQSGVRVIRDPGRVGQARSLNQIAATVESDYLCWLSDDNVLRSGALDCPRSILDGDSRIGMVALKVQDITGSEVHREYLGRIADSGILNVNQGMLRTKLFKEIGGFDELLRDYYIDVDITTRVLLQGYDVVYSRQVLIDHYRDHETPNWIDAETRRQRLATNRAYYLLRYPELVKHHESYKKSPEILSKTNRLRMLRGKIGSTLLRALNGNSPTDHDWSNVHDARFISPYDFMIHACRPYYLRQSIDPPRRAHALKHIGHPTLAEAETHVHFLEENEKQAKAEAKRLRCELATRQRMEEKRIRREKALQEIAEAKKRRLEARAGGENL
jgi:GT2 family glycosyltransferase